MAKNRIHELIKPYVITKGSKFRLKDFDPGDTAGFKPEKGSRRRRSPRACRGSASSRRSSTRRTTGACC